MTTTKPPAYTSTGAPKSNPLTKWLVLGGVGVVVVAAVIAVIASAGGDSKGPSSGQKWGEVVKEIGAVTAEGSVLPSFETSTAADLGIGLKAPTLSGTSFDSKPLTITPGKDGKLMVVFLAHWCPHCQKEVPLLVDWMAAAKPPKDLTIVAVATGTRADQPNFPPSQWLARENWPTNVMVDSADHTGASAYGLSGYPYFVLVNSDGTVSARESGEIAMESLDGLIAKMH